MSILTKDDILDCNDLESIEIEVPEWGGSVIVSTMTGTARDNYESSIIKMVAGKAETDLYNIRAKLLASCLVDAEGNRLFDDDDIERLGMKSSAALERIFIVAQKLNAVTDEDIEEMAKN